MGATDVGGRPLRLLFDVYHPAQLHLFRNLAARVVREGGQALVATRDKDVTVALCRGYGLPQEILSRPGRGLLSTPFELLARTRRLLTLARRMDADALLGSSPSVGIVARLTRRSGFLFIEDDAKVIPLLAAVVYPVSDWVCTPDALAFEKHGRRHLTYRGYHELAYLHPNHFRPDPEVPKALGLAPDRPYFVLRFVSLKGHHDTQARGMPLEAARQLVGTLSRHGRVLITSETPLAPEFEPYRFPLAPEKLLDVLAFASLYAGDSQSMSMEAAVLGVPGLRCNSFVGRIAVLEELQHKYGLTEGFLPTQADDLLRRVDDWLANLDAVKAEHQRRREMMLEESVDLAEWQWSLVQEKVAEKRARSGTSSA